MSHYTMTLYAEAAYIMHRLATAFVPLVAANASLLVHLMEIFEHARSKVERTIEQLHRLKVHLSTTPKVPLSWLSPFFIKSKLCYIADGQ